MLLIQELKLERRSRNKMNKEQEMKDILESIESIERRHERKCKLGLVLAWSLLGLLMLLLGLLTWGYFR